MATDQIWKALDAALTLKRTRQATLVRLNRLLQKRFSHLPDGYLTQENCDVWRESLTAQQLRTFNPDHTRADPRRMAGPVVVFESTGQRYMFDGTNRLNVWLRAGDNVCHEVIVVRRKHDG